MATQKNKVMPVLLLFPGREQHMPQMPLSLLVMAAYLRGKKVPVEVVDARLTDYKKINFNEYCLVGISAMTGDQLSSALEACSHIREVSKTKIVWGGCHATFFPEQVCKTQFADYVIRREGEETLYELLQSMHGKKDLKDIKGLTYKTEDDGKVKITHNPDRPFLDMNELLLPAYDLVDMNKYEDCVGYFSYEATRGCPHRCKFCYVHNFHDRKWRCKKIEKIISELKEIKKMYNVSRILICSDNFFFRKDYVMDFCNEIIKTGIDFKFYTTARANYISRYDDREMNLLKNAGFKFIGIGAESGSKRILDFIKKDITTEDIFLSAQKCVSYGITPIYSFMVGVPCEEVSDLYQTVDCFLKLRRISNKIEINGFYIFAPYPGSPIYEDAVLAGFRPPQTLQEWAKWDFSVSSNLPWLNSSRKESLSVLSRIILFFFIRNRFNSYDRNFKKNKIGKAYLTFIWDIAEPLMSLDGYLRLKFKVFHLAPEWVLFGKIAKKYFKILK